MLGPSLRMWKKLDYPPLGIQCTITMTLFCIMKKSLPFVILELLTF